MLSFSPQATMTFPLLYLFKPMTISLDPELSLSDILTIIF